MRSRRWVSSTRLSISAGCLLAGSLVLGQAQAPGENLVRSPSFESDDGWETAGPMSRDRHRTGTRSLKLSTATDALVENNWTRVQAMSAAFAIKPSTRYTLSVWVCLPATFKTANRDGRLRGAHASLPIFDAKGEPIGPSWIIGAGRELSRSLTTAGGWVCLRRRFTTPSKAVSAQVRLGVADVGAAFFDDVSLVEAGSDEQRPSCAIASPLPSDAARPVFGAGRWTLRGEPFLPFGFWASARFVGAEDVANAIRHHCNLFGFTVNTALPIAEQKDLAAAMAETQRQGVYVALLTHTFDVNMRNVGWAEAKAEELASFAARHDNVIAWMLKDDAPCRTEVVDAVHQNATLLRRFDRRLPFMVDLIPRRGSLGLPWGEWAGFLDMMCTYVYPVPYAKTLHFGGGLEEVQQIVDLVQEGVRPAMLWYVVQAHIQDPYRKILDIDSREQFLASPEQVRLITYYVIQRGVRGIYFFRYRIETAECLGEDRMAEIGLMGCEMDIAGRFFAAGERQPPVPATIEGNGGESVEAVPFQLGEETLYLLTRHGRSYQVHVDAQPRRVRLMLPESCKSALRVRWPRPEDLPIQRRAGSASVEVGDFDLSELIVTSRSAAVGRAYADKLATLSADAALFAVEGAEATAAKFEGTLRLIAGAMPQELSAGAAAERERVGDARKRLEAHDLAGAFVRGRAAQRAYRGLITRCVRHARDTAQHDTEFKAYRSLVAALVKAGRLNPQASRRLGHTPSFPISRYMAQGFDPDEPLATVFYTLPKFYGAFADEALRQELAATVQAAVRGKGGGAQQPAQMAEALAALSKGDFAAVTPKITAFLD